MASYCGTGHRPNKLGGYSDAVLLKLIAIADTFLTEQRPSFVISGVALGWDTALAIATLRKGIPLIAAVPFKGQELQWPMSSQDRYRKILSKSQVEIVCDGGYSADKMQRRNEWMVNNSDAVVALWDGTSGGTYNCVQYAKSQSKYIFNCWVLFK